MFIFVVGLNHKSAPVEIREQLTFSESTIGKALDLLYSEPGITGCAILSTCNRTEIYGSTTDIEKGLAAVRRFVTKMGPLAIENFANYFYTHTLYDAIRHLFRVASGLDSMVLGETQILGQVRRAYQLATEHGVSNSVVNTWFQQAITVGKRVRTETGIDQHAVSTSYTAVELARQVFNDLNGKTALILGAGKMSELTLTHLIANGVSTVLVANRSFQRAEELAGRCGGEAIHFDKLEERMHEADIVISCTAATHYVIRRDMVERVMATRKERPIFFIDIAVPRDIEPSVGTVGGVHLFDIDDLQNVIDQNLAERSKAAALAEVIIDQEINDFLKWLNSLFVVPTIVALKAKGEEVRKKELERVLGRMKDLPEKDQKTISALASSIVNQLLHDPITQIRHYAASPDGHLYSEILQNLFGLAISGQRAKGKSE
ncbi:glutamyl-tRNA reductase [Heliophilum fasciatum]|uniref:Glutamyl-tRNA reductase n=1 Tax=Heliophilum fasciatum TaxID=35700 RepID=A7UGU9_9FIRM|nr:glutamyl-tRNA reductase [Heliophilum fasciatum]ABU41507.1 HemA2 [Heliophilum fasciatum]MCW2278467.1 glutamyl-tRNA reductase [Heliophilum fasciatum]TCP63598.1 glutamyl-tRNA reductase [Heliophilum fasciatum]